MGVTNQQLIIADVVRKLGGHPTALGVFRRAKRRLPAISLATVYRNLDKLVVLKQLSKVHIYETRYEAVVTEHAHFVCERCGEIKNINTQEFINAITRRLKGEGIQLNRSEIVFYGVCSNCLRTARKSPSPLP